MIVFETSQRSLKKNGQKSNFDYSECYKILSKKGRNFYIKVLQKNCSFVWAQISRGSFEKYLTLAKIITFYGKNLGKIIYVWELQKAFLLIETKNLRYGRVVFEKNFKKRSKKTKTWIFWRP